MNIKTTLTIGVILLVVISIVNFVFLVHKDYDCKDFDTYDQAMKVFKKHAEDIYDLDRDHNGLPCERLPGGPKYNV